LRLAQPHTRPAAVRFDELDAGPLERPPDSVDGFGLQFFASFQAADRVRRHLGKRS
jgi:hypothetical protein